MNEDSEEARRARRATAGPTVPLAGVLDVGAREQRPARDTDALERRLSVMDEALTRSFRELAELRQRVAVLEGPLNLTGRPQ